MVSDIKKILGWLLLILVLLSFYPVSATGIYWLTKVFIRDETSLVIAPWFMSAAFLGFLTGYATGASKQPGTGVEFLKFIGVGVIVPLIGGVISLIKGPEIITESSRFENGLLVEKITETSSGIAEGYHPLLILGGFFCFYSVCAVLGILTGIIFRDEFKINIMFKD